MGKLIVSRQEITIEREDDAGILWIFQRNGEGEPIDQIAIPFDTVEFFIDLLKNEWESKDA